MIYSKSLVFSSNYMPWDLEKFRYVKRKTTNKHMCKVCFEIGKDTLFKIFNLNMSQLYLKYFLLIWKQNFKRFVTLWWYCYLVSHEIPDSAIFSISLPPPCASTVYTKSSYSSVHCSLPFATTFIWALALCFSLTTITS